MCSKCKSQYGKGGWDKDKEGNDEFCRYVQCTNTHVYSILAILQCKIFAFIPYPFQVVL